ncbi:hypothetical protein BDR07DRAFT_187150 [Suillus spraguei]|nr:hypothetical protein BDR07DRAFT_187150 [Suillus spraguei]
MAMAMKSLLPYAHLSFCTLLAAKTPPSFASCFDLLWLSALLQDIARLVRTRSGLHQATTPIDSVFQCHTGSNAHPSCQVCAVSTDLARLPKFEHDRVSHSRRGLNQFNVIVTIIQGRVGPRLRIDLVGWNEEHLNKYLPVCPAQNTRSQLLQVRTGAQPNRNFDATFLLPVFGSQAAVP